MKTITLITYTGEFEAPKKWLENNIDERNLNEFINSYTLDESEWLYIEFSIEQEERDIKILTKMLEEGVSLFKNKKQEGVLHDCSYQNYKYQFSYFDQFGPIGDIQKNTLQEMAKSIIEYEFIPCEREELKIIK